MNHLNHMCFSQKNDHFFMKQYMVQAVLYLNEVYQMYLKKAKKKQNRFGRKLVRILERIMWFKL